MQIKSKQMEGMNKITKMSFTYAASETYRGKNKTSLKHSRVPLCVTAN